MQLFLGIACLLWVLGALLVIAFENRRDLIGATFLGAGSLFCLVGAAVAWSSTYEWTAGAPVSFGIAPLFLRADSLSAMFLALLAIVCLSVSLFSPGYLSHLTRLSKPFFWSSLFLFVASMALVLSSGNAITFVVFWELMSLSSAALVGSDFVSHKTHRATLIYLGATRIATAFLLIGFIWMYSISHSCFFTDWNCLQSAALPPALLILGGLSIKAGIWPFHLWLPYAHPAAPSPVSALMSAVMLKVAVYAVMRLFCLQTDGSIVIGAVMLLFGAISAIWGILFALAQQDLKRLLAYSSIENVGIIYIGLGLVLYAKAVNLADLATLAFTASLFLCFNHGLFKSLLFLGAGAVDAKTHTRELDQLGGLSLRMPYTTFCFLWGSAAICAIPPLNGFAGKWLIYQSLFLTATTSHNQVYAGLAIVCIGVLALVGGLALAVFTKAVGIVFLGRARSRAAEKAEEVSKAMVAAQILPAILCILLGILSPFAIQQLASISTVPPAAMPVTPDWSLLIMAGMVTAGASLIFVFSFSTREKPRRYLTWECGFGPLTARMQTTSESFSQPIERIVTPILQYRLHERIEGKDRRHFPEKITAEIELTSILETRFYSPAVLAIRTLSGHLGRLQAGSIHLYLLYMLATLIVLLLAGVAS